MSRLQRKYGMAALLLLTLLAAWFAPDETSYESAEINLPKVHRMQMPRAEMNEVSPDLLPKSRQVVSAQTVDIFYLPQPKAALAEAAASAATTQQNLPPALPYRYLGREQSEGRVAVFLIRDEIAQVAVQGDVLDQHYRVDQIAPDYIQFTYLPLRATQRLNTGNPS